MWGGSSSFPEGDDESAGDDEGASDPDRRRWGLVKADLGDDLGHDEEEGDVDAEELAEVPLWEIDEEAVEGEDGDAGGEPERALEAGGAVEAGLEEGVAEDLERGGDDEDQGCADG